MFLNTAERDFPMALNLASSLNPICTNIEVTIGSLTASIGIRYIKLAQIGWLGCGYALIGVFGFNDFAKSIETTECQKLKRDVSKHSSGQLLIENYGKMMSVNFS